MIGWISVPAPSLVQAYRRIGTTAKGIPILRSQRPLWVGKSRIQLLEGAGQEECL
jgi:hypothetical protein